MRRLVPLIILAFALPLQGQPLEPLSQSGEERIRLHADGRLKDATNLRFQVLPDDPVAAARAVADLFQPSLVRGTPLNLEPGEVRRSLLGTHVRMKQTLEGLEVVGGELIVRFDSGGTVSALHNRLAESGGSSHPMNLTSLEELWHLVPETAGFPLLERREVWFQRDGVAIPATRFVVEPTPLRPVRFLIDSITGELLMREELFYTASARVFESNPVTRLNDPSLRDHDDAPDAVPEAAYSMVELQGLAGSGSLAGPNVQIVDLESPTTQRADVAKGLSFDRSDDEFEEVMAYYHLDRSQRYLQSLGYSGDRRIIDRSLRVDAHAAGGDDNSFFVLRGGEGILLFGDGGVDDAEDPDILFHEYGHAIHDSIASGVLGGPSGSEARALSEGFGDYWAFSEGYGESVASGRDPFCVGDWDARCAGAPSSSCGYQLGQDCLRRVDGRKTMADYILSNQRGTEHRNGEIWSSALREIFVGVVGEEGLERGKRTADRIVLESLFGMFPSPTFTAVAERMLDVDHELTGGAHARRICSAMTIRGVLPLTSCSPPPRGELRLYAGPIASFAIPDAFPAGVRFTRFVHDPRAIVRLLVRVELRHPRRSDLRLALIAPDGRRVELFQPGGASGSDLVATFGMDLFPAEPLSVLQGMPAIGLWTLEVADHRQGDEGRLLHWSLLIETEGAEGAERAGSPGQFIPAAAHVAGAEGSHFVTDLLLVHEGEHPTDVLATFTPAGTDGRFAFRTIRLAMEPGEVIQLSDIVQRDFLHRGYGSIEIRDGGAGVRAQSRTYDQRSGATVGMFFPTSDHADGVSLDDGVLELLQIRNTEAFRSNVGVAETAGEAGVVEIRYTGSDGLEMGSTTIALAPWSQYQIAAFGGIGGRRVEAARATLRVVEGDARILGYAATIDNRSGDPIGIPAVRRDAVPSRQRLPVVARTAGALGTHWRTDLWLSNPFHDDRWVTLRFHPVGTGEPMLESLQIPAGFTLVLDDVLTRFGIESGAGQIEIDGRVLASSKTWTESTEGTVGQLTAARRHEEAVGTGQSVQAVGAESSPDFRTNIGIAESAGGAVVVRVSLFDSDGVSIASRLFEIGPNQLLQFGLATMDVDSWIRGRVRVEVLSGDGRIFGYISLVDNRSGDPTYIPMH